MPAHRLHRVTRTAAAALAVAALAAPTANARPIDQGPYFPLGAPTITRTVEEGFDWGSALVGAGGALATVLLAAAGASAAGHQHGRLRVSR